MVKKGPTKSGMGNPHPPSLSGNAVTFERKQFLSANVFPFSIRVKSTFWWAPLQLLLHYHCYHGIDHPQTHHGTSERIKKHLLMSTLWNHGTLLERKNSTFWWVPLQLLCAASALLRSDCRAHQPWFNDHWIDTHGNVSNNDEADDDNIVEQWWWQQFLPSWDLIAALPNSDLIK